MRLAANRFKEIQNAYDTLSDPVKKATYDGIGTTGASPFGFNPFGDIFDTIFKQRGPVKERGRDIQITVTIELMDVLLGTTKSVVIPKREKCGKCDGSSFVEYKACNECHGSGKTTIKQPPFNVWKSCRSCAGSGQQVL